MMLLRLAAIDEGLGVGIFGVTCGMGRAESLLAFPTDVSLVTAPHDGEGGARSSNASRAWLACRWTSVVQLDEVMG